MEFLGIQVPAWLVLLAGVFILGYIYATWTYDTFLKLGIPGPKPVPVFGNMLEGMMKGLYKFDDELVRKYGKLVGIYEGRQPTLLVADPEVLKQITVKEFQNFVNRRSIQTIEAPINQSLFALQNDHWKRVRSLVTPAFSSGKLRQMAGRMDTCAQYLVDHLMEMENKAEPVNMKKCAGAFAMDVIASTAFGVETNSLKNPEDKFVGFVHSITKPRIGRMSLLFMFPKLMPVLRKCFGIRLLPLDALTFFNNIIHTVMDQRKDNKRTHLDLMQIMVNAHKGAQELEAKDIEQDKAHGTVYDPNLSIKKAMTTDEILGQGLLFFVAGTETTGLTVSYFTYTMATHPKIQERLIDEIDSVVGDQETVVPSMFEQLPYLDMCVSECLRLYGPSVRVDRVSNNDTCIKGVTIPKGTLFAICIYAIQHNPDFWPDPYKFDPERFSPENKEKIVPLTYIPFGFGPRHCVGMRLALLEIKVAIVKLFQNFRFKTCEKTPVSLTFGKADLLKPVEDILLLAEKRVR